MFNQEVFFDRLERKYPTNDIGHDNDSDLDRYYSKSEPYPGYGILERTESVLRGQPDPLPFPPPKTLKLRWHPEDQKRKYPLYCEYGQPYPRVMHRGDHSWIAGEYWEDCTEEHERMLRNKTK